MQRREGRRKQEHGLSGEQNGRRIEDGGVQAAAAVATTAAVAALGRVLMLQALVERSERAASSLRTRGPTAAAADKQAAATVGGVCSLDRGGVFDIFEVRRVVSVAPPAEFCVGRWRRPFFYMLACFVCVSFFSRF